MEINTELLEDKFLEYNDLYFKGKLPTPRFGLLRSFRLFGQFSCNSHAPGSRLHNVCISMSIYYDWTEEQLRDILVHEMIHYKLERSKKLEKKIHGQRFMEMAAEMNEKHGLNITVHPSNVGMKVSKQAPRFSLARLFWTHTSGDNVLIN